MSQEGRVFFNFMEGNAPVPARPGWRDVEIGSRGPGGWNEKVVRKTRNQKGDIIIYIETSVAE